MSVDRKQPKGYRKAWNGEHRAADCGGVLSLGEARDKSVDELRADIIRSAARGQGPTFIAAKLDLLIEKAQKARTNAE